MINAILNSLIIKYSIKFLDYIVKNHKTHLLMIVLSVFMTYYVSNYVYKTLNSERHIITIEEIHIDQEINEEIDASLKAMCFDDNKELVNLCFLSWIKIERVSDLYILAFKDVRGYLPGGSQVISLKRLNQNSLYDQTLVIDENTSKLLENTPSNVIEMIDRFSINAKNYKTLDHIYKNIDTPLKFIKFTIVRKENDIIYVVTLGAMNDIKTLSDSKVNDMLLSIANKIKLSII